MKRVWAFLVFSAITYPLIPQFSFAPSDSNLPPCCRRDGKHHCGMADAAPKAASPTDPDSPAVRGKCPLYPSGRSTPVYQKFGHIRPSLPAVFAVVHPAATPEEAEGCYRVSFSRARQKRGPPALFS